MKRKLLILGALLGFSVLGFHKQATAISTCSNSVCIGKPTLQCTCPAGMPAAGDTVRCQSWYTACQYL